MASPTAIPRTANPPVIFLNGYQDGCNGSVTFAGTFGVADQLLAAQGRPVLFFNNCEQSRNAQIEILGDRLRDYIASLRYADGTAVPQVDVVAHSLGGLIVNSYLAGKGTERGVFQPPADTHIRKAVFIAVPFFGSYLSDVTGTGDSTQNVQLRAGGPLIFDLATWNQGANDLRGVDALAVVGTGGTGVLTNRPRFDDSTVVVTSASLDFAYPGRTRLVPYCHTSLSGVFATGCSDGALPIANLANAQHLTARILLSFLAGTEEWKTIGQSPAENEYLSTLGGLQMQVRTDQDAIASLPNSPAGFPLRNNEVVWKDDAVPGVLNYSQATSNGPAAPVNVTVVAGRTKAVIVKTAGPDIAAIIPNFSDVSPRAVAPGSFMSIYGTGLATSTVAAGAPPYPTTLGGAEVLVNDQPIGVQYASATQLNAVVPDGLSGLVTLGVRTATGIRKVNLLVEPSVPSLFPTALAVSGALITTGSPAHAGDFISLYLTGLGQTQRRADGLDWAVTQPVVTVGGQSCAVQYAGRAPGFIGLDQINCRLAATISASDTSPVVVAAGTRTATMTVPVR